MTEKKITTDLVTTTQQAGVVRNIMNQLKLIFRLMGDSRVNIVAKLIPIGTLVYLISPVDALSIPVIGVVDDAMLLWLGSYVFTELCPPAVVEEHMKDLYGLSNPNSQNDVIDGQATEVKDDSTQP